MTNDHTMARRPPVSTTPRRLNRYGSAPLYRQLSGILEAKIRSGEYPPDERLPTEGALVGEYGVNRITVREALGDLARRGLIHTQQGRGSFPVRPPVRVTLSPNDDSSVTRAVSRHGMQLETVLLDVRDDHGDQIAGELGASGALRCLVVLRTLDDVPWMLTQHWYAPAMLPDLEDAWPGDGRTSLFDVLDQRFGIRMFRATRTYWAEVAGPEEAEHLGIPSGFPVFVSHGLNKTQDGAPILVSLMKSRGDRTQVSISLDTDR